MLFQKDINKVEIMILINFENKINIMNFAYGVKLDLQVQKTDINA